MKKLPLVLLCLACSISAGCQSSGFNSAFRNKKSTEDVASAELAELKESASSTKESQSDFDSAIKQASAEIEESPSNEPVSKEKNSSDLLSLMNQGKLAQQQEDWTSAKAHYRKVLDKQPNHAEANHRMAVIADLEQNFSTANYYYQMALKADPHNADLLNDVGYSHFLQKNYSRSEAYYQEVLNSAPSHKAALMNYGRLLAMQGKTDRAMELFRRAQPEINPQTILAEITGTPGTSMNTASTAMVNQWPLTPSSNTEETAAAPFPMNPQTGQIAQPGNISPNNYPHTGALAQKPLQPNGISSPVPANNSLQTLYAPTTPMSAPAAANPFASNTSTQPNPAYASMTAPNGMNPFSQSGAPLNNNTTTNTTQALPAPGAFQNSTFNPQSPQMTQTNNVPNWSTNQQTSPSANLAGGSNVTPSNYNPFTNSLNQSVTNGSAQQSASNTASIQQNANPFSNTSNSSAGMQASLNPFTAGSNSGVPMNQPIQQTQNDNTLMNAVNRAQVQNALYTNQQLPRVTPNASSTANNVVNAGTTALNSGSPANNMNNGSWTTNSALPSTQSSIPTQPVQQPYQPPLNSQPLFNTPQNNNLFNNTQSFNQTSNQLFTAPQGQMIQQTSSNGIDQNGGVINSNWNTSNPNFNQVQPAVGTSFSSNSGW